MAVDVEERSGRVRRPWWRRPWMLPAGALAVAFLVYSLPPYLALDPARSRVPAPAGFPEHYWLLVGHVLFGSVAMITGLLQVWPWLRRAHPAVHRRSGRLYVFGGVLPGGLLALVVGSVSPFGPVTRVSDVLLAVLWLGSTVAGLRAAVGHRYADHRRWMVRSVTMTMSIVVNRVCATVAAALLGPQLATTFGGSETALGQAISALSGWPALVAALLVSQWWLDRRPAQASMINGTGSRVGG